MKRKERTMTSRLGLAGCVLIMVCVSFSAHAQKAEDLNDLSNTALTLNMVSVGLGAVTAVGLGVDTMDGYRPGAIWSSAGWLSVALGLGSGLFAAAIAEQETNSDRKTLMALAGLAGLTAGATNFFLVWTASELPEEPGVSQARLSPFFVPDEQGRLACGLGLSVTGW